MPYQLRPLGAAQSPCADHISKECGGMCGERTDSTGEDQGAVDSHRGQDAVGHPGRRLCVRAWPLVKHIANTAPACTLGGWVPRRLPVSLVPAPPRAPAAPLRFMGAQVLLALPPFPCVFVLATSFVLDKCLISLVLASRPSSLPLLGKPDLKSQLLQQATGVISPARTFA